MKMTPDGRRNEYLLLEKRLESFANWPDNHHIKKEAAANAGFYYSGYSDCIRCFHCNGGLKGWQPEDDVRVEHARFFPNCALAKHFHSLDEDVLDGAVEIEIDGVEEERSAPRTPRQAVNAQTQSPMRKQYATLEKRLETLTHWPESHHIKKELAAKSGFYFAGYSDCLRCFWCGGGLRNWEAEDDVRVEHARWFPKCEFVRQALGEDFMEVVKCLAEEHCQISMEMVESELRRRRGHNDEVQTTEKDAVKSQLTSKL